MTNERTGCPIPELSVAMGNYRGEEAELDAELIETELAAAARVLREDHPEVVEVKFAVDFRNVQRTLDDLGTVEELVVLRDGRQLTGAEDDFQVFEDIYGDSIGQLSDRGAATEIWQARVN